MQIEKQKEFELTLTQKDIYFDQLKYPNNPLYNIGGYIRMKDVDLDRLITAHSSLIMDDDLFGLRIKTNGQEQYISESRSTKLPVYDFSAHDHPEKAGLDWLRELFETPLVIEESELFKAAVLKISNVSYWYVGFAHHLIMDGWGFANWARRIGQYYNCEAVYQPKPYEWSEVSSLDQSYLAC